MTRSTLVNKVAIITGAASGIGKAAAIKLAEAGVKVGILDVEESDAQKVRGTIEAHGGEAMVVSVDIAQSEQVRKGIGHIVDTWGQVDIVFANAGINGRFAPIEDLTSRDWDETLETNLKGTFLTVKYAVPYLKHNGGSVIITSSINGNRTFSGIGMSAYSASKAGQVAFAKMAALELAEYNIRVNVICPGAIATNIDENTEEDHEKLKKVKIPIEYPEGAQPLAHGPGSPEEVADLVHFLASDASKHISGTELFIDGTESLLR